MDRLQTIQIFVQVADLESFTRAAESLGLPRSTVSAAVRELEARLQTRLIQRTTRAMHLTVDGAAYLDWCRRLLAEIQETEATFRESHARPRGRLRVDVPSRIGRLVIAPRLIEFCSAYPDVEMELRATDRTVNLIEEGIDCAVRVGEVTDSSLVARPLGEFRIITCASPEYLAKHGTPKDIPDLASHFVVGYGHAADPSPDSFDYLEGAECRSVTLPTKVATNNAEVYIACSLAGLGIIQIPAFDVVGDIRSGRLIEILPGYASRPMPVFALYPHRRHLSQKVKVFVEWMRELLAGQLHA